MEKMLLNKEVLVESQDRVIRIFDEDGSSFESYARVWFDVDGFAIIAEPYAEYATGRRYYMREVDFDLID